MFNVPGHDVIIKNIVFLTNTIPINKTYYTADDNQGRL